MKDGAAAKDGAAIVAAVAERDGPLTTRVPASAGVRETYDEWSAIHMTTTDSTAKTTRIAVPSEAPGGLTARRSGHFGHCACFTVVDVVGGEIAAVEIVENYAHEEGGCMRPVLLLAENTVDAIVVDGIGGRPLMGFNQVGIAVHAGRGDDVQSAVAAYIEGALPEVGLEGACHH